jgi:ABC-type sugar transport system ATPase subunit
MHSNAEAGALVDNLQTRALLLARGLNKSFPGVRALRDVNFDLYPGEVHGLVGANGAGKSTLIRVLAGATRPESGSIMLSGRSMQYDDPRKTRSLGISIIYQEINIAPEMTAMANVFLGNPLRSGPFIDYRRMKQRFLQLSKQVGLKIAPLGKAGALSAANQQMIQIMRALQSAHSILIMDEPTAALGPFERNKLYDLMKRLRDQGAAILLVSHDLDEILSLSGRVSVMRDGRLVATDEATAWNKDKLVRSMLGDVHLAPAKPPTKRRRQPILRVDGVSLGRRVANIGFTLHRGEVLGIAGLVGAGRSELLRVIAGAERGATGLITINGADRNLPRSVREAVGWGIALVPEERKTQGLILDLPAMSNILITDLGRVSNHCIINKTVMQKSASALARRVGYRIDRLRTTARSLSGGNQQKLVIAKWLHRRPQILLLDEPTRGIDIGSKQEIFRTIRELADEGMGVVLVSSDLEEVVDNADNILVMARGRKIASLPKDEASVHRILELIFAVEQRADDA